MIEDEGGPPRDRGFDHGFSGWLFALALASSGLGMVGALYLFLGALG